MNQDDLFRRKLIDCMEKIVAGWRDWDVIHGIEWRPIPNEPFLRIAYRDLETFISEDLRFWENEQEDLWIDLALLKRQDITAERLLECRSDVRKRLRSSSLTKDDIDALVKECLGDPQADSR